MKTLRTFHTEERHPIDPRILIIQNKDDYKLWLKRSLLRKQNIHGLLWKLPQNNELPNIANNIANTIKNNKTANTDSYDEISYWIRKNRNIEEGISQEFGKNALSTHTIDFLTDLIDIVQKSEILANSLHARLNSSHPRKFHKHNDSLTGDFITCALTYAGSIVDSKSSDNHFDDYLPSIGQAFEIPPEYILLADGIEIAHRAPQTFDEGILFDKIESQNDRVNVVIA